MSMDLVVILAKTKREGRMFWRIAPPRLWLLNERWVLLILTTMMSIGIPLMMERSIVWLKRMIKQL
jgi:hypothetical protein